MPAQNTSPADYPQAVRQQIALLAQNIVTARKRRRETQAQWAQRLGVSQPTMARIERGDPSVSMASYVMCMWLINQAQGLADLIAPQNDMASLEREVARTRTQARVPARAQPPAEKAEGALSAALKRDAPKSPGAPRSRAGRKATAVAGHPGAAVLPIPLHAMHRVAEAETKPFASGGQPLAPAADRTPPEAATSPPARAPNTTAAGLAALVSGRKKARP